MNISDTKKAILTALRAYERGQQAKTCALAQTNLRHGQQWQQRSFVGMQKNIPTKLEFRYWSPERRELFELQGLMANAEWQAHENLLARCGLTQLQHEKRYWEDRARSEGVVDRALKRRDRKRPKKK